MQPTVGVKVPVALVVKLIVPEGVMAVPGEVSVAVAVQEVAWFTIPEGEVQLTLVVVARATVAGMRTEWTIPALVPVTLTLYLPRVVSTNVDIVRTEVADFVVNVKVTLAGLNTVVDPEGVAVALRLTVPVKLLLATNVIVELPVDPG